MPIRSAQASPPGAAFALGAVKLLLHLVTNQQYGFHRDELYFIVCGAQLAWGYVDQGPLVPALAALSRAIGGESLAALRFLPAIAGAFTVFATCWLARLLGGGRFSQIVAGTAVLIAPAYLRMHTMLHIPTFESTLWTLGSLLLALLLKRNEPRLFLLLGVVCGVGILNKPTMVLFGAGLIAGLAISSEARAYFRSRYLWLGGALALPIVAPFLWWQVENGWPSAGFVEELNTNTLGRIPWWAFLLGQIVYLHPLSLPLWVGGLVFLLRSAETRRYRSLAWIWIVPFLVLVATGAKIYYLAAAYPPLLAAGGVWLERSVEGATARRAVIALLLVGGALLVPAGLPIVPLEHYPAFVRTFTGGGTRAEELHEVINDYYDMKGWGELASAVRVVRDEVREETGSGAGVFTSNYGEASALRVFASDLPPARSGHLSFHLWGAGVSDPEIEILVGFEPVAASVLCADAVLATRFQHPYDGAVEDDVPIVVCRPRRPLREVWSSLRHGF